MFWCNSLFLLLVLFFFTSSTNGDGGSGAWSNQNGDCIWFKISQEIVVNGWYARSCNLSIAINNGGTYALTGLISSNYNSSSSSTSSLPISFSTLLQNGLNEDENATISWSGVYSKSIILAYWVHVNTSASSEKSGVDYFYPSKVTI